MNGIIGKLEGGGSDSSELFPLSHYGCMIHHCAVWCHCRPKAQEAQENMFYVETHHYDCSPFNPYAELLNIKV